MDEMRGPKIDTDHPHLFMLYSHKATSHTSIFELCYGKLLLSPFHNSNGLHLTLEKLNTILSQDHIDNK